MSALTPQGPGGFGQVESTPPIIPRRPEYTGPTGISTTPPPLPPRLGRNVNTSSIPINNRPLPGQNTLTYGDIGKKIRSDLGKAARGIFKWSKDVGNAAKESVTMNPKAYAQKQTMRAHPNFNRTMNPEQAEGKLYQTGKPGDYIFTKSDKRADIGHIVFADQSNPPRIFGKQFRFSDQGKIQELDNHGYPTGKHHENLNAFISSTGLTPKPSLSERADKWLDDSWKEFKQGVESGRHGAVQLDSTTSGTTVSASIGKVLGVASRAIQDKLKQAGKGVESATTGVAKAAKETPAGDDEERKSLLNDDEVRNEQERVDASRVDESGRGHLIDIEVEDEAADTTLSSTARSSPSSGADSTVSTSEKKLSREEMIAEGKKLQAKEDAQDSVRIALGNKVMKENPKEFINGANKGIIANYDYFKNTFDLSITKGDGTQVNIPCKITDDGKFQALLPDAKTFPSLDEFCEFLLR